MAPSLGLFYFKNLLLNFSIWFPLALAALPLFALHKLFARSGQVFQFGLRTIIFLSPFYMWLAIFTLQPHKEERFMYPAYPFLALNAAFSLHIVLVALGTTQPRTLIGLIPARVKLFFVTLVMIMAVEVGLSRSWSLYSNYSAPMHLYTPLQEIGSPGDSVCFGKEWYRFPSSYFLPRDMRAKFIRSEFRGLLPGEFSEARTGFGFWSGTWLPTIGLNDRNEEDIGKYVDLRTCSFLVDTQFPEQQKSLGWQPPPNEPDYIADLAHWQEVKCVPFLDAAETSFVARTIWLPEWDVIPERFRRKWGRHCLLQQKR